MGPLRSVGICLEPVRGDVAYPVRSLPAFSENATKVAEGSHRMSVTVEDQISRDWRRIQSCAAVTHVRTSSAS